MTFNPYRRIAACGVGLAVSLAPAACSSEDKSTTQDYFGQFEVANPTKVELSGNGSIQLVGVTAIASNSPNEVEKFTAELSCGELDSSEGLTTLITNLNNDTLAHEGSANAVCADQIIELEEIDIVLQAVENHINTIN